MSSGTVVKSNRKFPRRAFNKPVAFTCKGLSAVTQGVEIGEGGLSIQTDVVFNILDKVVVNFYLPQAGFFTVRAEVKNTVPAQVTKKDHMVYGLGFIDVNLALKRKIRAYVARTLRDQDDLSKILGLDKESA